MRLKIAGLLGAAGLLLAVGLPFLINVDRFRPELESEASAALGRNVGVGNLRLSLLSRSVSVEDLSIADDPAFSADPFVRARALTVGVEIFPLIASRTIRVTDITLAQPEIALLQDASGEWNFSSLGNQARAAAAKAPASDGKSASAPPDLSVGRLNVKEGRLTIGRLRSSVPPQVIEAVNIEVRDFSTTTRFPLTVAAKLRAGGDLKLDAKVGPIDPADAAATPLEAHLRIQRLNLAASRFADPSAAIAGLADFDGAIRSDGRQLETHATLQLEGLKLVEKGSPAGRPVEVKYTAAYDLAKRSGALTRGDLSIGKALATLTGTYQTRGDSTHLRLELGADRMPVDELETLLPALGVVLPTGSSLDGGTLSAGLKIAGPLDRPVITGSIRLSETKVVGFNLGAQMSAISALSGINTGPDTSIRNLSADLRVAPDGTRVQNINLIIVGLGTVEGSGVISPGGALNFRMHARLSSDSGAGLTQLLGGKSGIPFLIRGTASRPSFIPDVPSMVEKGIGGALKSLGF
ncbi:MAG: AsmA family protein [Deltaproteobacteria bacterium]|nr:AsmA family protein [Deltaproteobacteria bacterium]